MRYLLAALAAGAITLTAGATVVYEEEAAFLAVIQDGYYLEDFDGYTFGSFTEEFLILEANGWRYTIDDMGGGSSGLYSVDGAMSTNSALNALTVTFDPAADKGLPTAVGGWFWPSDYDGNFITGPTEITLYYEDGSEYFYTFDPTGMSDFRGFTDEKRIDWMVIEAPDVYGNAWPVMDHFYVGSIPAPGVLALLGLAGLARSRRR
jgi:hypothetical protein